MSIKRRTVLAHKTIKQTRERPIVTTICAQKKCRFFGKEAQQGVCYSAEGEVVDWAKSAVQEKEVLDDLKAMRKREGKGYVRALEAYYACAMMNWTITLDECVRLRRDLALAKDKPRR